MRFIENNNEFKKIFLEAKTCFFIDSYREKTALKKLIFDDGMICTHDFARLLSDLINRSNDKIANFIVMDPDPVEFFYRKHNKYPVIEFQATDVDTQYIRALNAEPGAMGIIYYTCVITNPGIQWFVHAMRESGNSGGHLWIPEEWVKDILVHHQFLDEDENCP